MAVDGRAGAGCAGWLAWVVVAHLGCINSNLQVCGNGLACPPDKVCVEEAQVCATPEQVDVCVGVDPSDNPDDVRCTFDGIDGYCIDSVCQASQCGNGIVDLDEVCDDGDRIGGDGCSADCRSTEECGNGLLDVGEQCDCGDASVAEEDRLEGCDGPNSDDNSLCGGNCMLQCGDGVLLTSEICDPMATMEPPLFCKDLSFDYGVAECSSFCTPLLSSCLDLGFGDGYSGAQPLQAMWGDGASALVAGGNGGLIHHFQLGAAGQLGQPTTFETGDQHIMGIHGRSASDIYAVTREGAVLHFDGAAWTTVYSDSHSTFRAVWVAPGSADVFVVGAKTDNDGIPNAELVVHSPDGAAWNEILGVLDPETQTLKVVWGSAADDVYVASRDFVSHYDGVEWLAVTPVVSSVPKEEKPRFTHLAGLGSSLYIVGYTTAGNSLILRRDDVGAFDAEADWTVVLDVPGGPSLERVAARGTTDILAFGTGGGFHFDGTAWMRLQQSAGSYVSGIVAQAAGYYAAYFSGAVRRSRGYFWSRHQSLGSTCHVTGGARDQLVAACGGDQALVYYSEDPVVVEAQWTATAICGGCGPPDPVVRRAFHIDGSELVVTGNADGDGSTTETAYVFLWDGVNWNQVDNPANVHLNAGTAVTIDEIWVAGRWVANNSNPTIPKDAPYVRRMTSGGGGDDFSAEVLAVVPDGVDVNDVTAPASDDVYAAVKNSSGVTQLVHYNGTSWSTFGPTLDCLGLAITPWQGSILVVGVGGCGYLVDGSQAEVFETGTGETLSVLSVDPVGGLFIGGSGGTLLHFDGSRLVPIAPFDSSANIVSFTAFGSELYVGTSTGEVWGLVGIDGESLDEAAGP